MHVDGACHCGAIAYEAVIEEDKVQICHCTDCQTLSGAPFRASAPALAANFKLLRGAPKTYVKTAESGNKRVQAFCGDCGAPIYATEEGRPRYFNLRLGAIRQRAEIVPKRRIWCGSALAWSLDVRTIPEKSV